MFKILACFAMTANDEKDPAVCMQDVQQIPLINNFYFLCDSISLSDHCGGTVFYTFASGIFKVLPQHFSQLAFWTLTGPSHYLLSFSAILL